MNCLESVWNVVKGMTNRNGTIEQITNEANEVQGDDPTENAGEKHQLLPKGKRAVCVS